MRFLTVGIQTLETSCDLRLRNCGFYGQMEREMSVLRENGRADHHIIFAAKGQVDVVIDRQIHRIRSGEAIYFPPHMPQQYTYRPGKDTAYYWLHYDGTKAAAFAADCALPADVFHPADPLAVTAAFRALLDTGTRTDPAALYAKSGGLLTLLATVANHVYPTAHTAPHAAEITHIAAQMRAAPEERQPLPALAAACGVSECHFIRLFHQQTGYSPQQYRKKALLEKAKDLLVNTALPINEISFALRIEDPLYFSRMFKTAVGTSPARYRAHAIRVEENI